MRERRKPKIYLNHDIYVKGVKNKIGYIRLVSYLTGDSVPHLEYAIDEEEYRNKGIMKNELPRYLKMCKKYNFMRIIAIVKDDNIISMKLLENNGFIEVSTIGDNISYIAHLDFTPDILEKMLAKILLQ